MQVCITGMHRSGTSLVANLLQRCGLHLGEENDLLPASEDNRDGYWEHRGFVELNDEILRELGGSWDEPPAADISDWPFEQTINPLRVRGEMLIRQFAQHEHWGWKDPRTCLTFRFWAGLNGIAVPFWLGHRPPLKVIICLRDPLEVDESLRKRKFTPSSRGLELWLAYNHSILDTTLPEERIVTHYESFFRDPAAELRRLLEFTGMSATKQQIEDACGAVSKQLRHRKSNSFAQADANGNSHLLGLYAALCEQANLNPKV